MVRFQYQVDQDTIELQASHWLGLERLLVNGQLVKNHFNFAPLSKHKIKLSNGHFCRLHLLIDPQTQRLVCRIYKKEKLLASLKQGKGNQAQERKKLNAALIISMIILGLAIFS
ncbi:MAG: hypothetical protein ACPGUD_11940 [Parashewanella sp.]